MAKKKKMQAVQAPKYTPYDVSGKIGGDAFEVIGSDASSMEAIARQPEASSDIRSNMILAAALVEGVALFAVIVCVLCIFIK